MSSYYNLASGEVLSVDASEDYGYVDGDVDFELLRREINLNYVQSCFRIFVLYADETIAYEIPSHDIKLGGSYNENYQNGQRRTLSFTLYNYDGRYTPDINTFWAGTRLRFDLGVKISTGKTYWFRKGTFVINSVTPSETALMREVSVQAGDKFELFDGATGRLGSTYIIDYGVDIYTIIRDILHTDMGNGCVLDPQDFIYPNIFTGKKTQVRISKNAGDTLGSILTDLATQLSAEIFYNSCGKLVIAPINEVTLDKDKPLLYSFDTQVREVGPTDLDGDVSSMSFTFDYNQIINRIIVVGTGVGGGALSAVASNDDPASPLCWKRIGYRTGNIINDSNIYTTTLAQERADYELRKQLILKSSTSTEVFFNPLLEVNNIIAISDKFFELTCEKFLIQSVSCSLDFTGRMNISFTNLNNLPFTY